MRAGLAGLGVAYRAIGVLAGNSGAKALYARAGFRPWTETLIVKADA